MSIKTGENIYPSLVNYFVQSYGTMFPIIKLKQRLSDFQHYIKRFRNTE